MTGNIVEFILFNEQTECGLQGSWKTIEELKLLLHNDVIFFINNEWSTVSNALERSMNIPIENCVF